MTHKKDLISPTYGDLTKHSRESMYSVTDVKFMTVHGPTDLDETTFGRALIELMFNMIQRLELTDSHRFLPRDDRMKAMRKPVYKRFRHLAYTDFYKRRIAVKQRIAEHQDT